MTRGRPPGSGRPVSRDLAAALSHYRRAANLTTERAAAKSGYSRAAIHAWQQGRTCPSPFALRTLAETYGVTVETLRAYREPIQYLARRVGPPVANGEAEPAKVERVVGAPHLGCWEMEAVG